MATFINVMDTTDRTHVINLEFIVKISMVSGKSLDTQNGANIEFTNSEHITVSMAEYDHMLDRASRAGIRFIA